MVEDLVTVLALVLLPPLSSWLGGASGLAADAGSQGFLTALGITLGQVSIFVVLMLVVGRRVFPWLLAQVARTVVTK